MHFNSNSYLLFIFFVVVLYYNLSHRNRLIMLLIASYLFYWMWSFKYSLLLVISTLIDYKVAIWIEETTNLTKRRLILAISLITDLSMLCFFKYANFFSGSLAEILGFQPWPILNFILPLGISFYTFQIISYTIDVYRGVTKARRSLLEVALFISFFPHLIAGPIMRANQLMPEIFTFHPFNWSNIQRGLGRFLIGMFKKVYLADAMALIVNEVYQSPESVSGAGLWLTTYAFAVQIYCDFSGYCDIAIGSALLLGIHLPENFNKPYLSESVREFWRRWHISLSNWLRDYLYVSLGGNRKGDIVTYLNLMITMLIGGLWHGAGWQWVIWGGMHGSAMCFERLCGIKEEHPSSLLLRLLRWFLTFHFVCLSWIFFRANGLSDALLILNRILTWAPGEYFGGLKPLYYLAFLLIMEIVDAHQRWLDIATKSPLTIRLAFYVCIIILVFTFQGVANPEFIYFQF